MPHLTSLFFFNIFELKLETTLNSSKPVTQVKKETSDKNVEPLKSSVKSNKPITLDFANMISALEVNLYLFTRNFAS